MATVPPERHIDPEHRRRISEAARKGDLNDVKLRPVPQDDRPFMIVTAGHIDAYTMWAIHDLGLEVVGVTHYSGSTNVHVKEADA